MRPERVDIGNLPRADFRLSQGVELPVSHPSAPMDAHKITLADLGRYLGETLDVPGEAGGDGSASEDVVILYAMLLG